ncbi:TerD family protein [Cellulophaga sp. E16_2]|uniref:Stress protein n=1 Tax=Cellulophaga algicola (strain DSM 14237 / IC166 / ACAM 630) TaxID=688270 RepID=E6X8V6_CELAD|nr:MULTISPECIES: TerD family protein [Cellulophaga]ADV48701.1 stress protein [Cellulophaga algicola DSM 14237]MBO0591154.1 TerD family protein [Cellulophaga sp. E16_2]
MAINLQKGQKIEIGLSKLTIGLGWDPNEGTGFDFDLDASAFLLNSERKLSKESHFIFYNNLCGLGHNESNPCEKNGCTIGEFGVRHTGDDPDGNSSDGDDDEAIMVDLNILKDDIEEILFVVTIEDFVARKQNFGQVRNSYIRIVDNTTNEVVAKYELDEDFSIETAVEFGRLYKRNGQWKFEASGIGYKEDLGFFVNRHYSGEVIK